MAFRYKKGCTVCVQIHKESYDHPDESRLYRLIQDAQMKKTSLLAVSEAYVGVVMYPALRNHSKKHQHPSDRALAATAKAEVSRTTRNQELAELRHRNELLQGVIDQVMAKLDTGELKMSVRDGLTAAKIQGDFELKQVDQQLELQKMVNFFASGSGKRQVIDGTVVDEPTD